FVNIGVQPLDVKPGIFKYTKFPKFIDYIYALNVTLSTEVGRFRYTSPAFRLALPWGWANEVRNG
uniref:hypothetical protein n=1 Tax=Segatella sp. TaxID=2974253 RepID=UPI003AAC8D07